jgi:hypothetical protein
MDLKENKRRINAIDWEIDLVRMRSTPEIEQTAQRLRELREEFARYNICPILNKLVQEKYHLLNLNKMERMRLDAKKPIYPEPIRNWLQAYRKTHKGTYRIRAVGNTGEWVIFTKLPDHGQRSEHFSYLLSKPEKPLFTQHGKLTKAALAQMIQSIELSLAHLHSPESAGAAVSDSVKSQDGELVPQAT